MFAINSFCSLWMELKTENGTKKNAHMHANRMHACMPTFDVSLINKIYKIIPQANWIYQRLKILQNKCAHKTLCEATFTRKLMLTIFTQCSSTHCIGHKSPTEKLISFYSNKMQNKRILQCNENFCWQRRTKWRIWLLALRCCCCCCCSIR